MIRRWSLVLAACFGVVALAGLQSRALVFYSSGPSIGYATTQSSELVGLGTYANLMTQVDAGGRELSFLATEEAYGFVKDLELRNLVVPVVGNFAGPKAIRAIGRYASGRGATVAAFYVSNVEDYLGRERIRRNGEWGDFCANVATLPLNERSVFIRPLGLARFAADGSLAISKSMLILKSRNTVVYPAGSHPPFPAAVSPIAAELTSCADPPAPATDQRSPRVAAREVTFVAAGDPSDPPRIVGDFNGWEGGAMTPSSDRRTYTLRVTLDPAARIEYLVAYRGRFELDPGNPHTVPAPAGPHRSELRMPQYREPERLPPAWVRGTVSEVPFESRRGDRRRIRVYVPAVASRPLPILYVHDGDILARTLDLPSVLDSLIDAGRMAPALVVFIDAVDRHEDYEPGSPFRDVFTDKIVPLIESRFAVVPGRRALMGLSRSTVGVLDACVAAGVRFEACALVAPAIPSRQLPALAGRAGATTRYIIETGTYDVPLITGARALRRALEERHAPVRYVESPQGHNHTAFRRRLPAVMTELFPPAGRF